MESVQNKIVLITGGANGIGQAIVTVFCKAGADVVFCDIDELGGKQLCKTLSSYKCTFVKADISDAEALENIMHSLFEEKGDIDIIINNAGVSIFNSIMETTIADFDQILSINLRPVFILAKLFAKHRAEQHIPNTYGRIINIASTRYLMSEPNSEAYAASKGGIVSLTHALAVSLSPYHITANCISPGWIQTANYDQLREADHTQHPSRRVGKPEDIAQVCLFLSNPANDFINGENIVVDGGMTKKMIYEE